MRFAFVNMDPMKTKDWLIGPQQRRSQDTTDRILGEAIAVLSETKLEDVSVADLARRAQVSVGGFYARFTSKDALLHAIDDHLLELALRRVRTEMSPDRLADAPIEDVVLSYVATMLRFFGRHRALIRQIVIKARSSADPRFVERARTFSRTAHGLLKARLLERKTDIHCESPEESIEFALMMVSAAAREAVLFGDRKLNLSTVRGRRLVVELVRAFLAYLGVEGALAWSPAS